MCKIKGHRQKIYKQSLLPLLTGKTGTTVFEPQVVVSSAMRYGEEKKALYYDRLKYIRSEMSQREELYNTAADPQEKNSINDRFPEKIKEAIELLNRHFQFSKRIIKLYKISEVRKDKRKPSDPDQKDKLKSLGYF